MTRQTRIANNANPWGNWCPECCATVNHCPGHGWRHHVVVWALTSVQATVLCGAVLLVCWVLGRIGG